MDMAKTVAEVIVATLHNMAVKRIYGVVGDSLNGLTAVLQKTKDIDWVHVRHEEVAAFAAGAEAQLTKQLAVCAGSCGPGNLHLINGLYDAHRSQAPVLAIAAQIPSAEIGSTYFQETTPDALFKECSYFCETLSSVKQLPQLLHVAIQTAITKRGVAVLTIPGDIMQEKLEIPTKTYFHYPATHLIPSENVLKEAAALLNTARTVTLFCGKGCESAKTEVLAVCEKLKAPIVHTLRAKEYFEADNPYDVGMTGFIGFASGFYAMQACDVLLVLGTSFPYRQFYPKDAKIIQIDKAGEQLGRRTAIELGIVGDVKASMLALLPLLTAKKEDKHLSLSRTHYKKSRALLDKQTKVKPNSKIIPPQFVAKSLNQSLASDAIVSCDVGTPTVWAARYIQMIGKRRLLGSFNHGSMANALAQAIGAKASYPKRQVVALCGDGGFTMLMGDLLTLLQAQLAVKIIILNNSSLGFVALEMKAAGLLDFGTKLQNPNFAALANSVNMLGIRVETPEQLKPGLLEVLAHPGPALLDIVVNSEALIIPPKITLAQVKGFSLFALKAIMNGEGNQVMELLKTNKWDVY